jgi:glycosyltransferase involved in cell wall biosynthesis
MLRIEPEDPQVGRLQETAQARSERKEMQMTMICCPFKTSYGSYASSLMEAIERKAGSEVKWVASNCGCGDPIEVGRNFQAGQCDYFEMPIIGDFRSKDAWKRRLRGKARNAISYFRAKKFANLAKSAEVIHFQQILNAYGSNVVFHWLRQPSHATRIITVHELDGDQSESPERNKTYNLADGVIVHCEEMGKQLVDLGVSREKVHVVLHGATIPASLPETRREGIIFYAGHKVMSGKGIQTLFKAMSIIQQGMGTRAPVLKIHGHYGDTASEEARKLAAENGLESKIVWLNQLSAEEMVRQYQESLVCVLPYTRSFAGLPASVAAANRLPVVCTRKAGLPDHLGDAGVWVEEENPKQLAERIMELLSSPQLRQEIAARLLTRAQDYLQWDVIAERTLRVYEESAKRKAGSPQKT